MCCINQEAFIDGIIIKHGFVYLYTDPLIGRDKYANEQSEVYFIATYNMLASETFHCPVGFYKCPSSYCIPPFLICNDQSDCPEGEEELQCGRIPVLGLYSDSSVIS